MNDSKSLVEAGGLPDLYELIKHPIKLAEFLTGMLTSEKHDWMVSSARLIQATIKCNFLSQLGREIQQYIEKGRIPEDFLKKPLSQQSLNDLLTFIDAETPDEERFEAMKTLFFRSVFDDSSEEEQVLSYQLMQLIKKLESGDLLVLKACHNLLNEKLNTKFAASKAVINMNPDRSEDWLQTIATQIGHGIKSLIAINEERLSDMKLINPVAKNRVSISCGTNFRLTDLGYRLCKFLYEK